MASGSDLTMASLTIEIRRKAFAAQGGGAAHEVLRDVELKISSGEFVCLLGPSGCGKTTLLNIVAGLDRDFEGRILWPARAGQALPAIGYVFQNPALLPWRSVRENLRLVMSPDQVSQDLDARYLQAMGLEAYGDSYPKSLSLGMSRRVALARALVIQPDVLLMDEPFVSLDEDTAGGLRELLLGIWRDKPTTVLFVTHDSREALFLGQRLVTLAGRPASVARDDRIGLSPDERHDPALIEVWRDRLCRG